MADQERETLYSKLVKQISELQSYSKKNPNSTVDISESFKFSPKKASATYPQLLSEINEIERKGSMFQKQPKPVKPQPAVVQQPIQLLQAAPAGQAQQAQATMQIQRQTEAPQQQAAKISAERELAELTRALPVTAQRFAPHKLKMDKEAQLVLPNLSLMDQIAELERLFEGIRSNILSGSDFELVKREINALAIQINKEKEQIKKKRRTLTQDEIPLWEIRDQRIKDIIILLRQKRR